ncbi:MAG: cytidylate kinase-like family protein [Desulfobacteraceae bacterium]|nr:cytidylate kinase-like family protein [Desulfobacteraceae bacterium]
MNEKNPSIKEFTSELDKKLEKLPTEKTGREEDIPVITICMEPGSGGHLIASEVAKRLDLKLYDRSILVPISNLANVDSSFLDAIEKERPTAVHDFITSVLDKKYVYKGNYLRYLKELVEIIGRVGKAVIVGRGANFILPAQGRFSIRVIAPLDIRVKNVSFKFGVTLDEAKKRIKEREKRRKAFVKDSFYENIDETKHYDLIINTARMDLETSVEAILGAIAGSRVNGSFDKENSYILRKRK